MGTTTRAARKKRASRSTPAKAMPKCLPGAKEIADALEQEFITANVPVMFPWKVGAALAHVSADTLRRAARDGELFASPITPQRTLLTRRSLAVWIANRAVKDAEGIARKRTASRDRMVARRAKEQP